MDQIGYSSKTVSEADESSSKVPWKDLREWIRLIEERGLLKRIVAPVDADEELSAIIFMATRDEAAPALMFDNIKGGATGMSVLSNMLGASARRYAVAMGLDDSL